MMSDGEASGEELKLKGNERFRAERYNEAADFYTKALTVQPGNHVLYSNRSACYSKPLESTRKL